MKPVATGGSYNDLTDLPTLHAMSATGSFNDMVDKPTAISGLGITDYTDIDFDDLGTKPTTIAGYGITDAFDGSYLSLTDVPPKYKAEPTTSVGQAGDVVGDMALTESYLYVCVRDFDGADGCWKRITLSSATW